MGSEEGKSDEKKSGVVVWTKQDLKGDVAIGEDFSRIPLNRAQRLAKRSIERRRKRALAKGKSAPESQIIMHDPNACYGRYRR